MWFIFLCRDPSILDCLELTEEERAVLIDNINRRLTPQAVKIRADIEVACYGYEGIDAVKEALRAGLTCSTECMPIKVKTDIFIYSKMLSKCNSYIQRLEYAMLLMNMFLISKFI